MYKRKARILFIDDGNSNIAVVAEVLANKLGVDWLEAKSAATSPSPVNNEVITYLKEEGLEVSTQPYSTNPSEELITWADTVIGLNQEAWQYCKTLPATVQKKHWPMGSDEFFVANFHSAEELDAVVNELKVRIKGMIGGLKMMST